MTVLSPKTKILLWASNIWYLGEGMLGPLFAVFAQRVGGNILDITAAWAVYMAATGALMIYIGRIAGKKVALEKLLLLGYALNALFTFGYLLVSSPLHLLLVQFGLGVAAALAVPPWSALYATAEKDEHAAYVWGLVSGAYYLVTAVAVIIGGLIVSYFSFTTLFVTMGLIQIFATVYQTRILRFIR